MTCRREASGVYNSFRSFVEQVRVTTDIVELIGNDIELSPAGRVFQGLSPFHPETHPSFCIWPETQSWYDFSGGYGLGGDVFAYVQQRDRVGFKDAVFSLAERAQIRRPDQDEKAFQQELALLVERRDVERLLTQAAAYYHRVLPSRIRKELYQQHYGLTDKANNDLQLGWADGHLWDYFRDELKVERNRALRTGLFVIIKGGKVADFFRDRLVFPYWRRGQVVYFIARSTKYTGDETWERSKYKKLLTHSNRHSYVSNTVKNDCFYNEDAVRCADELLITEGVTDCISAMQAGIHCISPVTVRFRKQDVPRLLQLTGRARRITICNDSEESGSGLAGALETAAVLFEAGRDVRIAQLPRPPGVDKVDLNGFLKEGSVDSLRSIFGNAKRYLEYLIEDIPADTPKLDLYPLLRPILERLVHRSVIEQDGYLDIIVNRFKVGRRAVKSLLRQFSPEQSPADKSISESTPSTDPSDQTDSIKGEVFEDRDHYYTKNRSGEIVVISSFHIEPTARIHLDGGELIVGNVTTDKGQVIREVHFPPTSWHSKRQFIQTFPSADMQWTGTDDNVQGVLRIVSRRNIPLREGTQTLGYLDTANGPRWVAKDLVLGSDGPLADSDIIYIPNGSTFPETVRYRSSSPAEYRAIARRIYPDLLQLNEPAVVLPALGWFFATPFRPRIMRQLGHFPILWIWGSKGTGKTTMAKEIFWSLFGIHTADPFSATETEFALIKLLSSTNAVPVFIDEYRPDDMPRHRLNTLHRLLRRLYGGELEERGRANLSLISYRLSAPVCVGGEARADDPALVDRLVSVTPDHNRLQTHPQHVEAFKRLRTIDLGMLALPYIQFALGRNTADDLKTAISITDNVLTAIPGGHNVSSRCRDNLRVVVFGLTMFEAFARKMGVLELPELDVESALRASVDELMDGEKGAKNSLDLFIETCSVLAYNGNLIENKHYAMVEGLTCLHLRSVWEIYLEHRRKTGQQIDASAFRALRRMLRENVDRGGYVKDISKQILLGDQRPRTIAIDLDQASKFLDVEEFPQSTNRTWGGHYRNTDWVNGND